MKNKIYFILILAFILSISSCKKNDGSKTLVSNSVVLDGTSYPISKVVYLDYGTWTLYGNTPTHHNFELYATDGEFVISNNNQLQDVTGKIVIYANLYGSGTQLFKSGTYNFIGPSNAVLTDAQKKSLYENKNILSMAKVLTSENVSTSLGINGVEVEVKSGTITIEGTKPNLKIIYDLTLVNNKTIKGSYSGNFSLVY